MSEFIEFMQVNGEWIIPLTATFGAAIGASIAWLYAQKQHQPAKSGKKHDFNKTITSKNIKKISGDNNTTVRGDNNVFVSLSGIDALHKVSKKYAPSIIITPQNIGELSAKKITSEDDEILRTIIEREKLYISNKEEILSIAEGNLKGETADPNLPGDEWLEQFFDYAKTASDEKKQRLWAHFFSQKIKSSKTVKPHTLHCLKVLDQVSALNFEQVCKMAIKTKDKVFVLTSMLESLEHAALLELETIGLINADRNLGFYTKHDYDKYLQFSDEIIELIEFDKKHKYIPVTPFTDSGIELFEFIGSEKNDRILHQIKKILSEYGVLAT